MERNGFVLLRFFICSDALARRSILSFLNSILILTSTVWEEVLLVWWKRAVGASVGDYFIKEQSE